MRLISKEKNRKIKLGKKTERGYEYKAKVDFGQDLSAQIFKVIKEKKINEIINKKVEELRKTIKRFIKKQKNLQYYYEIGKKLLFLKSNLFKDVSPRNVCRRILEELPEILPHIKNKKEVIDHHLPFMYNMSFVDKNNLSRATWDQWYEILKFSRIYKNKLLLKQILKECKNKRLFGPALRKRIKEIRKQRMRRC